MSLRTVGSVTRRPIGPARLTRTRPRALTSSRIDACVRQRTSEARAYQVEGRTSRRRASPSGLGLVTCAGSAGSMSIGGRPAMNPPAAALRSARLRSGDKSRGVIRASRAQGRSPASS